MRVVLAALLLLLLPLSATGQQPPSRGGTVKYPPPGEMTIDATGGAALRGSIPSLIYNGDVVCFVSTTVRNPTTRALESASCRCTDQSMSQAGGFESDGRYLYYNQLSPEGLCPAAGISASSVAQALAITRVISAPRQPRPQSPGVAMCPGSVDIVTRAVSGTLQCHCPAISAASGQRIWGSGIYTGDSHICTAALHAGAITPQGGRVTATISKGCPNYQGGPGHHGIVGSPYTGGSANSFSFNGASC